MSADAHMCYAPLCSALLYRNGLDFTIVFETISCLDSCTCMYANLPCYELRDLQVHVRSELRPGVRLAGDHLPLHGLHGGTYCSWILYVRVRSVADYLVRFEEGTPSP